jgi:hypothetical protein
VRSLRVFGFRLLEAHRRMPRSPGYRQPDNRLGSSLLERSGAYVEGSSRRHYIIYQQYT